ncbi:MAG: carboxypeptidase regulatory-like domain-containing protein [Acidobacteria bacterium]|nr:carboxypeptidase regulatory-like domain-containing protein [Acidobacteriota bacterium]
MRTKRGGFQSGIVAERFFLGSYVLLLSLVLSDSFLLAQGTAEIVGRVKDASGAVLPGVSLTIVHKGSGQERRQTTDRSGNYVVVALPIGEYSIKAELPNFKTHIREGIVLQVGQQARVDLVMEVGAVTQYITVEESVPLLRTTNAEVSEVIANQRIVDLPLNGRQFMQLTLLSDNVFLTPVGTRGAALAQTGRQVVVGGQRVGHNMYWLDGVSITDQYFNNLVVSPSVEAIQEFKIQKSIYSAEFGGKASANVNAATKSGTNEVHGAVYEFIRNDLFDTRNFFDRTPDPPPLQQNQFGVSVGGPVRKDSAFFFGNYEGFRERRALTRTFSLPSPRVRSGDFSGLPAIYDPLSTDPATGRRRAFEGNRIPTDRLDPVAAAFLRKIPLPNLPGEVQNYNVSSRLRNDHDQFTLRGDQRLGVRDSLFGRFTYANLRTFQPYGNTNLNETLVPGFGYDITTKTQNVALNYTRIFGPSLIQEFRFGYLRAAGGQESENFGTDFAAQSGLQGVTRDQSKAGFPTMNFSEAYSIMGDPQTLLTRRNNSFDFFGNLSWIRGAHSMKYGAYLYRLRFNPRNSPNARGALTFSPRFSSSAAGAADGNAFADFLLGYPTSATVGIGRGEMDARTTWAHFYAQDDWQATPAITLNLGVRWEINTQMHEAQNRFSNVELNRLVIASDKEGKIHPDGQALLPLIPVPYVTSEEAGYERSLQRPTLRRIAPRIGLAWSAFGSQKTVIRTGFGLFFNQAAYSINEALSQNLPFYFNKTVTTAADTRIPTLSTGNILLASPTGSIGGSALQYGYRSEYAESWTLSLQRELTPNWAVLATYFGSHVVGADNSTWANTPLPGPGPIDPRRPNPNLSGFREIHWGGWSKYHSLALKLEKRYSRGLTFDANWTWSKSLDDASDPGATFHEFNIPQNVADRKAEKALSSFDHRHRLVFTSSYELPFGEGRTFHTSGWVRKLAEGWSVSGIGTFQSGAPITINTPGDRANIGPGPAQRPHLLRNPNLPHGQGTAERWFDTEAFALPDLYTFGNAGRNIVFEAGETQLDFSAMKNTKVGETTRLEFRAEIFNIFNRVNFVGAPGRIAFTPNFGRLSNTGPSRQMQFGLKLSF